MDSDNGLASSASQRLIITVIASEDGTWRVHAHCGNDEASSTVTAPEILTHAQPDENLAREIGARLYTSIFEDKIDQLLELARFRSGTAPLPIDIAAEGELDALPWEWLFDPESERFVALSTRTPLSRRTYSDDQKASNPPVSRKLHVRVYADSIDEDVLSLVRELGADPSVDARVDSIARQNQTEVHVAISHGPTVGPAKLAVVVGDMQSAAADSVIRLPADMPVRDRDIFLLHLTKQLARGAQVDAAVVEAKRQVADESGIDPVTWAMPRLTITQSPVPLVKATSRAAELQASVRSHTVGWLTDSLSGVVISLAVFVAGLILYRIGFSSSKQGFQLDIFSPLTLYDSFKSLIVELSTYNQLLLLGICSLLLALTVLAAVLWRSHRLRDLEAQSNPVVRFGRPLANTRALSVLTIATLTILSAFLYQQYLWHVQLPIDSGTLGVAITQASADFDQLLTERLTENGQSAVVRTLPLDLDASEEVRARELADRLGADAVIIAHEDGESSYVAYVMLAEQSQQEPASIAAVPSATGKVNVEHLAVPTLHATSPELLAEAITGVLAYERDAFDLAVAHLSQSVANNPASPSSAVSNFYLGNAHRQLNRSQEATEAFENAVRGFEQTFEAGSIGPLDELLLVKCYLALGELSVDNGELDRAITWYQKAVGHRLSLLGRHEDLPDPAQFRLSYATLYRLLAEVYRDKGITEEERYWQGRYEEEMSLIDSAATFANS